LKVFERCAQLQRPEQFRSWLFSIARNDCLTHIRKVSVLSELTDELMDRASPAATLHADLDRTEAVTLVNHAVQQLKPELREVVVLREYNSLSYREIAEVIGSTESIVKSRLFTARQRLYEILKPIYIDRSES
jgi:RNA polymerase sigma-70 factor (ECF subfamily)